MGQGLAGSCLALRLLNLGKRVVVFDEPDQNRSSAVAAGLFNPITGKLLTRTWLADHLFPELHHFYQSMEDWLGQKFFYPQEVYRPFISVEEQNEWMSKSAEAAMRPYIKHVYTTSAFQEQINDPLGGILISRAGFIDVTGFMNAARQYLLEHDGFLAERFDEDDLQVTDSGVMYRQYQSRKIILCTGTALSQSKRFFGIPVKPLKGETLTISLLKEPELIFNRGVYIVPWPSGSGKRYKVGATYEARAVNPGVTEGGRMELLSRLNELLKIDYHIEDQEWGFRPTSPDRKPILGYYPGLENVVIFNGLGTKGVSLAPFFSAQLANWLLGIGEIQSDVNIARFKSLSSKSQ